MRKRTVHIVGQSHIDLAWLWPYYPETIYDCCRLTFMRATDNLERDPEYVFAQDQVPLYKSVEENFPDLFEKIRKHVRDGSWSIVGGMFVEAEGGEPCGESLVRQCVMGQNYFRDKFGERARVGWLPDNWTHPWQLPQILKKSGVDYLVFRRGAKGKALFWWTSPDGSSVLACRPEVLSFRARPFPDLDSLASRLEEEYGVTNMLVLVGSGDHGGGPTYQELQNIKDVSALVEPQLIIRFSRPSDFFNEVEREASELRKFQEELDFELVGDLINCHELKKGNRENEESLLAAEKFCLLASSLGLLDYPQGELKDLWERLLFSQFHDIIGGSAIPSVQEETLKAYRRIDGKAKEIIKSALTGIAGLISTADGSINIVVFNSLSWERTDIVNALIEFPAVWEDIEIMDHDGNAIPFQVLERSRQGNNVRIRILFEGEMIPPIGYRSYTVSRGRQQAQVDSPRIEDRAIENRFFSVKISPGTGYLESIYDKEIQRDIILQPGKGNQLRLIEDQGDSEGRLVPKVDRSNEFVGSSIDIETKANLQVIEAGPVRARIRATGSFGSSKYVQEVMLYAKTKRLDMHLIVDWHETNRALKVLFPVKMPDPIVTFHSQYGSVSRTSSGEEQPMQQWVDISQSDGHCGVAILNDSVYACNLKQSVVGLSLLRSPDEPSCNTDEGIREFSYSIYPHKGDWREADVVKRGYEFNNPLIAVSEGGHGGILPKMKSFISVQPKNVLITTAKKAERSDDFILRLYETEGLNSEACIKLDLNGPVQNAYIADLLEDEISTVMIHKHDLRFSLHQYEIATIKIRREQLNQF